MKNFTPRLNMDALFDRKYPQSTKNLNKIQTDQRYLFTRLRQSKSKNNMHQEQPFKKIPGITSIDSEQHSPQKQQQVTFREKLTQKHQVKRQLKVHIKSIHQDGKPGFRQGKKESQEWAILVERQLTQLKRQKAYQIAQIHARTNKSIPAIIRQMKIQLEILIDTILDKQYIHQQSSVQNTGQVSPAQNPGSQGKKVLKSGSTYADSAISKDKFGESDKRVQIYNRFSLCNNLLENLKQFQPQQRPADEGAIQLTFGNRNQLNTQQSTPGETMRSVKQFSNKGSTKRSNTPKRTIKIISNSKLLKIYGQQGQKMRQGRQAQVSEFNIGQNRRSSSKRIKQKIMRIKINPTISDFRRFE